MPKLTMDASVEEKRMQLADMAHRGILGDNEQIGDFEYNNSVFSWSDNDILLYYENNVTDELADKYAEAVAADLQQEKSNEPKRPDVYSFKLLDKMNMIANLGLTGEEREDKLNQIREAFEFEKLKFDAAHNSFASEKDREYFSKLSEQYSIDEYEQMAASAESDKHELQKMNAVINSYGKAPEKPNGFTRFWNGIQKVFTHKDLDSIKKYDEYNAFQEERKALERKIALSEVVMESISETNRNYNYEEHMQNKTDKRLELAKNIVRRTLVGASKTEGRDPINLSDEEIEKNARVIMEIKGFKKLVEELKADTVEINPDTFFSKFIQEMSDKQVAPQAEHTDPKQPQRTVAEESAGGRHI